jgi:hypothetical protein
MDVARYVTVSVALAKFLAFWLDCEGLDLRLGERGWDFGDGFLLPM